MTKSQRREMRRMAQSARDKAAAYAPFCGKVDQIVMALGTELGVAVIQRAMLGATTSEIAAEYRLSKNQVRALGVARLVEESPAGLLTYWSQEWREQETTDAAHASDH